MITISNSDCLQLSRLLDDVSNELKADKKDWKKCEKSRKCKLLSKKLLKKWNTITLK